MTTDPIVKIEGTDPQVIAKINQNFRVLTERMKELNLNLSYLDILHIDTIYTVHENDQEAALRQFIASCWNLLANYSGAYITSEDGLSGVLFKWQDKYEILSGDYIIRLPGNEAIVVPGAGVRYYYPSEYNASLGKITYTLTDAGATTYTITTPVLGTAPAYIDIINIPTGTTSVTVATGNIIHAEFYATTSLMTRQPEPVYLSYRVVLNPRSPSITIPPVSFDLIMVYTYRNSN